MTEPSPANAAIPKHRLEALSDGIYAIALTLLVLELRLPADLPSGGEWDLRGALLHLLPKLFAWILSFWVIALFWLAQQRLFRLCAYLDGKMVAWELVQLALISLFPFSNALLGEHGGRVLTSALYAAHLLALALVSWRRSTYILRHPELHAREISPEQERALRTRSWLLASSCIATFVLAFFVPGWNTMAMIPTALMSRLSR
jgi:uncharacterized membrane protein